MSSVCSVPGCPKPGTGGRGWCSMHYARWRRTGDPGPPEELRSTAPAEARFWAKVNKNGPRTRRVPGRCWLWTASTQPRGYGNFGVDRRVVLAHRYAYELLVGPIPEGTELDHLCRRTSCVNPRHLEAVEHAINVRRGAIYGGAEWDGFHPSRAQTHCKRGHEFTPENTRWHKGHRACRACIRAANQRYEEAHPNRRTNASS